MVVTPTASGKTLCYNLPVVSAILKNNDARALYLFPTKALSADQVSGLYDMIEALGVDIKTYTYDGDTQAAARKAIREAGHIVVTNPDMLHANILPHHTRWVKLFENLEYIVIDELHTYRGVFGSHLANVLRRLMRLCAFYGSHPRFILCSATIANPVELASQLTGREIAAVTENGSPMGERHFVFYNPPVVNRQLGIRRGVVNEYVISYMDRERAALEKAYPTFEAFDKGFEAGDAMLEGLTGLGGQRGVEFDEQGFAASAPLMRIQLKALVAQRLFDTAAFYRVMNPAQNEAYRRAVEILADWEHKGESLLAPED